MQPVTITTSSGRLLTLVSAIPSDDHDEEGFAKSVDHTFAVYTDDVSPALHPIRVSVETRLADGCGSDVWGFLQAEAVRRLEAMLAVSMPIDLEADEPD